MDIKKIKYFLFYTFLILLFSILRIYLSHNSWYDGVKLEGIKQISFDSILYAISNDQSITISTLIITKYWIVIVVFLSGLFSLLYKHKLILLILTMFYSLAYYLLVILTHSENITGSNLFYFESQWMCLSLIVCTPFLYETIKHIKDSKIVIILFLVIFIFKVPHFYDSLSKFKLRLGNLEVLVDDAKNRKLQKCYIFNSEEIDKSFLMTWGIPVETILLSTLKFNHEPISVKVFEETENISTSTDSLYTAFKFLSLSELNSQYFEFTKTSKYESLYK